MSAPDRTSVSPDKIRAATADLDRALRRLHLTRGDRQAIVAEVRGDLQSAAADGVAPATLIGPDVDTFARDAIEAGGYEPRPRDYPRLLVGGVLAAAGAVVLGYLLVVVLLQPLLASWFTLDDHYPTAGPVVAFAGIAVVGLFGCFAFVHRLLAGRPAQRETLTRAAVLTPLAAAGGIAAAAAVARDPQYSGSFATVAIQVLLVALPVLAALAVSRWWALRAPLWPREDSNLRHTV